VNDKAAVKARRVMIKALSQIGATCARIFKIRCVR
jgi:hypothetical protein